MDEKVRTAKEIKAKLLKRAWEGKSKYTPAELIRMMQDAFARTNDMPEEHIKALQEIDATQPRGVMMLNALAAEAGLMRRYTNAPSCHLIIPDNMTIQ
ncbi:MAG TPA: hypothetical protein VIF12_07880 [Micavibrio sp.]|jgi:hypothetical protein